MSDASLVYADTSALGALLVAQSETEALAAWLDEAKVRLVSSDLLETELRRMRYLRTLDALHLEAAIRLDVEAILTYDVGLGDAASAAGLDVIAPGFGL